MAETFKPPLTKDEWAIVDRALEGRIADGWPSRPAIRAELIRRLVLGLEVDGRQIGRLPAGVRVDGCTVVGKLDLRSARMVGGEAANGLELRDCELAVPERSGPAIDARDADIDRLALVDCVAHGVDISGAHIRGDAMFTGLRGEGEPAIEPDVTRDDETKKLLLELQAADTVAGECWIRGNRARIDGWFDASGAQLFAPRLPGDLYMGRDRWYALSLVASVVGLYLLIGSRVRDGEETEKRFVANGGVDLSYARIGDGVFADGAAVSAPYYVRQGTAPAFYGFAARIGADVALVKSSDSKFSSFGQVYLEDASVGGNFRLWGARLEWSPDKDSEDTDILTGPAAVGHDLILRDVTVPSRRASLCMRHGAIGGSVIVESGVSNDIDLSFARVGQDIRLKITSRLNPRINLTSASCTGELNVDLRWSFEITGIRTRDIAAFYPGWTLIEVVHHDRAFDDQVITAVLCRTRRHILHRLASVVVSRVPGVHRREPEVRILQAGSAVMHDMNAEGALRLRDAAAVAQYVSFFCAYVWGDEGPFLMRDTLEVMRAGAGWTAKGRIQYSSAQYDVEMEIAPSGVMEMVDDTHVSDDNSPPALVYSVPVRRIGANRSGNGDDAAETIPDTHTTNRDESATEPGSGDDAAETTPDHSWPGGERQGLLWPIRVDDSNARGEGTFKLEDGWTYLYPGDAGFESLVQELRLGGFYALGARVHLDLTGFHAGTLDDGNARTWWMAPGAPLTALVWNLRLDGFEYRRITPVGETQPGTADDLGEKLNRFSAPRQSVSPVRSIVRFIRGHLRIRDSDVSRRLAWLELSHGEHDASHFNPQPYEHLARVWRSEGKFHAADEVTFQRLQQERRRPPAMFGFVKWALIEVPFKWGLSVPRAGLTVLLCIFIGWMGTEAANHGEIRVPPISTHRGEWSVPVPGGPVLMTQLTAVSAVASRAADTGNVEPVVVAGPVSDPLDEIECRDQVETLFFAVDVFVPFLDLRQESECAISDRNSAWGWRWAKSIYAIAGWYVISMFVLTASGLLRRQVEPS